MKNMPDLAERVRKIKASLAEGGKGSGNFGHAGRIGKRGGSKAGTGGTQGGIKVTTGTVDANIKKTLQSFYAGQSKDAGETMLFITTDGKYVSMSSGNQTQLSFDLETLRTTLRDQAVHLYQLKSIIHNHPEGQKESEADLKALKALRKIGFTGDYQIYWKSGHLRTVKDKTESLLQHLYDLREEALRSAPSLDDPVPEDLVRRLSMLRARL